ncbi:hypothetical protein RI129_003550, partial [Pyrocoelia pectoralis]
MGGHHHHEVKVPDYKTYRVEDAPELLKVQEKLAARGLCDPWLRNEVWRYDRRMWGTQGQRILLTFSRGFKYGFAAFVVTIIGSKLFGSKDDGHGHGH